MWIFASRYGFKDLAEKCLTVFVSNVMSVATANEMKLMENEDFFDLMEEVKHLVCSWCKNVFSSRF